MTPVRPGCSISLQGSGPAALLHVEESFKAVTNRLSEAEGFGSEFIELQARWFPYSDDERIYLVHRVLVAISSIIRIDEWTQERWEKAWESA